MYSVVGGVSIHDLMDDFVGLNEELDVHGAEDVVHKVGVDSYQDLFCLVLADSVPCLNQFLLDDSEVSLTLQ